MKWLLLLLAGIFEVIWAITMKYSNGFTILLPSIVTGITYILSALFLALALKNLPLGVAYVMWVGFGIIGVTLLGILLFQEKLTIPQMICVVLMVFAIAGLKFFAKH